MPGMRISDMVKKIQNIHHNTTNKHDNNTTIIQIEMKHFFGQKNIDSIKTGEGEK